MRDLSDNIDSANNVLSSIFLKYVNINTNFYADLSSNNITKFDVFYDTLFVETPNGFIFEKFYIDSGYIKPYNQLNLFTSRKNAPIDYWYDETKNKVSFVEIVANVDPYLENYISFLVIFKEFYCSSGTAKVVFLGEVKLIYSSISHWDQSNQTIEPPKITYNTDTKTFNVSFILRNSIGTLGLVSLNIENTGSLEITELNTFLPYATIDMKESSINYIPWVNVPLGFELVTESGDFLTNEGGIIIDINN